MVSLVDPTFSQLESAWVGIMGFRLDDSLSSKAMNAIWAWPAGQVQCNKSHCGIYGRISWEWRNGQVFVKVEHFTEVA